MKAFKVRVFKLLINALTTQTALTDGQIENITTFPNILDKKAKVTTKVTMSHQKGEYQF